MYLIRSRTAVNNTKKSIETRIINPMISQFIISMTHSFLYQVMMQSSRILYKDFISFWREIIKIFSLDLEQFVAVSAFLDFVMQK
jgi:hypothetical protein